MVTGKSLNQGEEDNSLRRQMVTGKSLNQGGNILRLVENGIDDVENDVEVVDESRHPIDMDIVDKGNEVALEYNILDPFLFK